MPKRTRPNSRETSLLINYNMTLETFTALEESQNFRCKICNLHKYDTKKRVLCVDHDHATGQIRGLLCNECNTMIGMAKENPTTLLKAIQYLKRQL